LVYHFVNVAPVVEINRRSLVATIPSVGSAHREREKELKNVGSKELLYE
jgi:hypothetical protein